jgi:Ala-tRNA(Pro) deacylase
VLPSTKHVDTAQVAEALGGAVRLAENDEIAAVFSDCEWGVVPPFGTLYGLPVLLDSSIAPDTVMVFETSTYFHAVRMSCRDFERLEQPRRLCLAK